MPFGCVICREITGDPNERFIIPFTHEMFCLKHRPDEAVPLSEFYAFGGSWNNWRRVKTALKGTKIVR